MSSTAQVNGPPGPQRYIDGVDQDHPDYIKNLQRPAEVKEDIHQMENRSRVKVVLNSENFKEELEEIVDDQIRNGPYPASLLALQQINELLMPASRGGINSLARASTVIPINDLKGTDNAGFVKGEKLLRCKVAALYRLVDLHGWSQGIYNHISARVSSDEEHFLLNPFGMNYSEVTASSLVKVDVNGEIVDPGTSLFGVSKAGFTLHCAIHQARPDIKCIIHLHTPAGIAVSSMKCGLLPMSQEAMICGNISYHDYNGIFVDEEERVQIARNLGVHNKILILRNHGLVACGETVEEAFCLASNLMVACESQIQAIPIGLEQLNLPSDEAIQKAYKIGSQGGGGVETQGRKWRAGEMEFEALMRQLDNSGYRTGYMYKVPMIKQEKKDRSNSEVEIPPSSSSFTYVFDGDYENSKYVSPLKMAQERQKKAFKAGWLTSPNAYKKTELEEIGTTTPKKITRWVSEGGESPNKPGCVQVKLEHPNQFAPQGENPKELKQKQKSIRKDYYEEKVNAGPQSRILEGISWDEAQKAKDGQLSGAGDQVIVVGAASKGIIQRDHQHNAVVYRQYYAANPFENMSEAEIGNYQEEVQKKEPSEAADSTEPQNEPEEDSNKRQEAQDTEGLVSTRRKLNDIPEVANNSGGFDEKGQDEVLARLANTVVQTVMHEALAVARRLGGKGQQILMGSTTDTSTQQWCTESLYNVGGRIENNMLKKGDRDELGDDKSNVRDRNKKQSTAKQPPHSKPTHRVSGDNGTGCPEQKLFTPLGAPGTSIRIDERASRGDTVSLQINPITVQHSCQAEGMKIKFSIHSTVRRRICAEIDHESPAQEIFATATQPTVHLFNSQQGSHHSIRSEVNENIREPDQQHTDNEINGEQSSATFYNGLNSEELSVSANCNVIDQVRNLRKSETEESTKKNRIEEENSSSQGSTKSDIDKKEKPTVPQIEVSCDGENKVIENEWKKDFPDEFGASEASEASHIDCEIKAIKEDKLGPLAKSLMRPTHLHAGYKKKSNSSRLGKKSKTRKQMAPLSPVQEIAYEGTQLEMEEMEELLEKTDDSFERLLLTAEDDLLLCGKNSGENLDLNEFKGIDPLAVDDFILLPAKIYPPDNEKLKPPCTDYNSNTQRKTLVDEMISQRNEDANFQSIIESKRMDNINSNGIIPKEMMETNAGDCIPRENVDSITPNVDDVTPPRKAGTNVDDSSPTNKAESNNVDITLHRKTETKADDIASPNVHDIASPNVHDIAAPNVDDIAPPNVDDIAAPNVDDIAPPNIDDIASPNVHDIVPSNVDDIAPPNVDDIAAPNADDVALPNVDDIAVPREAETNVDETTPQNKTETNAIHPALHRKIETNIDDIAPPRKAETNINDIALPRKAETNVDDVTSQNETETYAVDVAPFNKTVDITHLRKVETNVDDAAPPRKTETNVDDIPPPRKTETNVDDIPPPRKTETNVDDIPPPRIAETNVDDIPPPRKTETNVDDIPPPRKTETNVDDIPPPRKTETNVDDIPPPRKSETNVDDIPPPRKSETNVDDIPPPRIAETNVDDIPPPRKTETNVDDIPPPRKTETNVDDIPPPRKTETNVDDIPPPRKSETNVDDIPPPRKSETNVDDIPPPRIAETNVDDIPPPRKTETNVDDIPPPRKTETNVDDIPPPRKTETNVDDIPPPRKSETNVDDIPPPRKTETNVDDIPPPRKTETNVDDIPPPRKSETNIDDIPPPRKSETNIDDIPPPRKTKTIVDDTAPLKKTETDADQIFLQRKTETNVDDTAPSNKTETNVGVTSTLSNTEANIDVDNLGNTKICLLNLDYGSLYHQVDTDIDAIIPCRQSETNSKNFFPEIETNMGEVISYDETENYVKDLDSKFKTESSGRPSDIESTQPQLDNMRNVKYMLDDSITSEGPIQTSSPKIARMKRKSFHNFLNGLCQSDNSLLDSISDDKNSKLDSKSQPFLARTDLPPREDSFVSHSSSFDSDCLEETQQLNLMKDGHRENDNGSPIYHSSRSILDQYHLKKHNELMELSSAKSFLTSPKIQYKGSTSDFMPPLPDTEDVPSISDIEDSDLPVSLTERKKRYRPDNSDIKPITSIQIDKVAEKDHKKVNPAKPKWVPKSRRVKSAPENISTTHNVDDPGNPSAEGRIYELNMTELNAPIQGRKDGLGSDKGELSYSEGKQEMKEDSKDENVGFWKKDSGSLDNRSKEGFGGEGDVIRERRYSNDISEKDEKKIRPRIKKDRYDYVEIKDSRSRAKTDRYDDIRTTKDRYGDKARTTKDRNDDEIGERKPRTKKDSYDDYEIDEGSRAGAKKEGLNEDRRPGNKKDRFDEDRRLSTDRDRHDEGRRPRSKKDRFDEDRRLSTDRDRHDEGRRLNTDGDRHDEGRRLSTDGDRHDEGRRLSTDGDRHDEGRRLSTDRDRHDEDKRPRSKKDRFDEDRRLRSKKDRHDDRRPSTDRDRHDDDRRLSTDRDRHDEDRRLNTDGDRHDEGRRLSTDRDRHDEDKRPRSKKDRFDEDRRLSTDRDRHDEGRRPSSKKDRFDEDRRLSTDRDRHDEGRRPSSKKDRFDEDRRLSTDRDRHDEGRRLNTDRDRHDEDRRLNTDRDRHDEDRRPRSKKDRFDEDRRPRSKKDRFDEDRRPRSKKDSFDDKRPSKKNDRFNDEIIERKSSTKKDRYEDIEIDEDRRPRIEKDRIDDRIARPKKDRYDGEIEERKSNIRKERYGDNEIDEGRRPRIKKDRYDGEKDEERRLRAKNDVHYDDSGRSGEKGLRNSNERYVNDDKEAEKRHRTRKDEVNDKNEERRQSVKGEYGNRDSGSLKEKSKDDDSERDQKRMYSKDKSKRSIRKSVGKEGIDLEQNDKPDIKRQDEKNICHPTEAREHADVGARGIDRLVDESIPTEEEKNGEDLFKMKPGRGKSAPNLIICQSNTPSDGGPRSPNSNFDPGASPRLSRRRGGAIAPDKEKLKKMNNPYRNKKKTNHLLVPLGARNDLNLSLHSVHKSNVSIASSTLSRRSKSSCRIFENCPELLPPVPQINPLTGEPYNFYHPLMSKSVESLRSRASSRSLYHFPEGDRTGDRHDWHPVEVRSLDKSNEIKSDELQEHSENDYSKNDDSNYWEGKTFDEAVRRKEDRIGNEKHRYDGDAMRRRNNEKCKDCGGDDDETSEMNQAKEKTRRDKYKMAEQIKNKDRSDTDDSSNVEGLPTDSQKSFKIAFTGDNAVGDFEKLTVNVSEAFAESTTDNTQKSNPDRKRDGKSPELTPRKGGLSILSCVGGKSLTVKKKKNDEKNKAPLDQRVAVDESSNEKEYFAAEKKRMRELVKGKEEAPSAGLYFQHRDAGIDSSDIEDRSGIRDKPKHEIDLTTSKPFSTFAIATNNAESYSDYFEEKAGAKSRRYSLQNTNQRGTVRPPELSQKNSNVADEESQVKNVLTNKMTPEKNEGNRKEREANERKWQPRAQRDKVSPLRPRASKSPENPNPHPFSRDSIDHRGLVLTDTFNSTFESDADTFNTSAPAYLSQGTSHPPHDLDISGNRLDPSASFDTSELTHYKKHTWRETLDADSSFPGGTSPSRVGEKSPVRRRMSQMSLGGMEPGLSRTRSSSTSSNPLIYQPWRSQRKQRGRSMSISEMVYAAGAPRPNRSHSVGEISYNDSLLGFVAGRRRSRTNSIGDIAITSRMYHRRRSRSHSRASLGDTSFGSVAPSPQRRQSGTWSSHPAELDVVPVNAAPVKRSESAREPSKNSQLIDELGRKNLERTKSDRQPQIKEELGEDKPVSPSKSDTMKSTDSASGGETLEERSSKEGSPTKEHPTTKDKKGKKKKFRIPSFSKKKNKETKESAI